MAGLEVLYTCVGSSIGNPQDALICFVHWEIIKSGYRCVGTGDTVSVLLYCCTTVLLYYSLLYYCITVLLYLNHLSLY
ncbi:hypothetical protein NHX12_031143 [Muraenolepis orangiensis]|uniref:PI31 proteasome regulator N-terminal domain-containing protein n=1 Tax=Muraenolepis orangiensis TaxID=630683 RepID=A0A9Q0INI9_9TELE|nr:hypothetical protein NHX12_031143 [Muraenolepis orangiensis]